MQKAKTKDIHTLDNLRPVYIPEKVATDGQTRTPIKEVSKRVRKMASELGDRAAKYTQASSTITLVKVTV